jgi:hypothetical protein
MTGFLVALGILGLVFMISAISKAAQRLEQTDEASVTDTVTFLLGTPASSEDREAVNEFNDFIKLVGKVIMTRVY